MLCPSCGCRQVCPNAQDCSQLSASVPILVTSLVLGVLRSFLLCHCKPSFLPSQGPNSVFEVYLVGNNSNHFIISPTSIQGKADIRVRVAVPLDFETIPRYEFSVRLRLHALWDVHVCKSNPRVTFNQASLCLSLIHTMKFQSTTKWTKNRNDNNGKGGGGEEICSVPSLSFQHPKAQLKSLSRTSSPLLYHRAVKALQSIKLCFKCTYQIPKLSPSSCAGFVPLSA